MTDPRDMLETYAAGISGMGTTEQAAPEAIAALCAVLDLHPRSIAVAAVTDGRGKNGNCYYCRAHNSPPSHVWRGALDDELTDAWLHEHEDNFPVCTSCIKEHDELQPWPCPTVRAITNALGGDS